MERLTKEIAESIRKRHNVSKIFYIGILEDIEYFYATYIMGGKVGFPCIFGIAKDGKVIKVRDYDTLYRVRQIKTELEQVLL